MHATSEIRLPLEEIFADLIAIYHWRRPSSRLRNRRDAATVDAARCRVAPESFEDAPETPGALHHLALRAAIANRVCRVVNNRFAALRIAAKAVCCVR